MQERYWPGQLLPGGLNNCHLWHQAKWREKTGSNAILLHKIHAEKGGRVEFKKEEALK